MSKFETQIPTALNSYNSLKNQEFQRSIQVEYTRNHLFCSKAAIARTKSFTLLLPSRCRKDLPRVEFGKNESEDSWNLEDAQLRHMPVAQHLPSFLLSSSEAKSFQATPIWSQKCNRWLSLKQVGHHFLPKRLMLISACRSRLSGFTSQKEW